MFDIVIKNGKIVDGTGNPWYWGNVAIQNGKIAAISRGDLGPAKRVIDASGLVVAPGFCDLHTHTDTTILWHKHARSTIHEGVTTEAVGQCGTGAYAYADGYQKMLFMDIIPTAMVDDPSQIVIDWRSLEEWRQKVEQQGVGINIAPYIAHGTVRNSVMGVEGQGGERNEPTPEEMEKMKALIREAMEQGAFGMSTGLRYPWGRNCYTEEIIELCRVVKEYGGIYISHMRSEEDALIEAARELIQICETVGLPGSMTHHKAIFEENFGKPAETMRLIDQARARGVEIICDIYPWTHAAVSNLGSLFLPYLMTPEMSFKDVMGILSRIPDLIQEPETWARIKKMAVEGFEKEVQVNEERKKVLAKRGVTAPDLWDPATFNYVVSSAAHRDIEGKNLKQIAQAWGMEDYLEVARKLYLEDEGSTLCAGGVISEDDIITILKHPTSAISTDSAAYDRPWDLCSPLAWAHPRNYATYARVLQRYSREMKIFSLEEAVRKMTSLPMGFLGIRDRGTIKEGNWADTTVFDAAHVEATADFHNPTAYPKGIEYVLVNGVVALDQGQHTDALAGKVLRRA